MAKESVFRGILEFFNTIGIYDVVLPFILVFTIVFAAMEKTRVLGTDTIEGSPYPKKNLNAMVAFVVAFLVVASSRLVATINEAMANIVILLLLGIGFLMLIGIFYSKEDEVALTGASKTFAMSLMFVGILLIFLHAIKTEKGDSWLEWFWTYLTNNWSSNFARSIILIVVIVLFMFYIVKDKDDGSSSKKKEKED